MFCRRHGYLYIDKSWNVLNYICGRDDIAIDLYECDEYQLNVMDYLEIEMNCDSQQEMKQFCKDKCVNLYDLWPDL